MRNVLLLASLAVLCGLIGCVPPSPNATTPGDQILSHTARAGTPTRTSITPAQRPTSSNTSSQAVQPAPSLHPLATTTPDVAAHSAAAPSAAVLSPTGEATQTTLATPARSAYAAASSTETHQALKVDVDDVLNTIDYPFWGINYVGFWDPIQGSPASQAALRNAGVQLIRFPGGEPANWHDWASPDEPPYWTSTSTNELWAYAQGVGAKLLLQTNPTRNEVSDEKQVNDPSGAHAADWVRYSKEQAIDAPFWEIGNEPDIQLSADFDRAALSWYFDAFDEQAAAIKQVDPQLKVFGPAGTNTYQWWALHSLDLFLERAGDKQGSGLADGVSLHYYPTQGCAGWEQVISVAQDWPPVMAHIQEVIAKYDTRPLPVFISETNAAVGGMNCEIGQTMASALANADLLGAYRDSGVQAVQLFGSIHATCCWGILYGAGEARPADSPTPTYFMLPIWTQAGNQVLGVTGASNPATSLSVYAAKKTDGSVQVVAINKSASPISLTIGFEGFNPDSKSVNIYELRSASGDIWDKDVVYNNVPMPDITGTSLPPPATELVTGPVYSRSVPGYSLTLFDFAATDAT